MISVWTYATSKGRMGWHHERFESFQRNHCCLLVAKSPMWRVRHRLENYASSIKAFKSFMKLLVFLSPLAFPLKPKIVRDEGRQAGRKEGTEISRQGLRCTMRKSLWLYAQIYPMGLSVPTSDKGIDKASYELGTLQTVPMVWRTSYFTSFEKRDSFIPREIGSTERTSDQLSSLQQARPASLHYRPIMRQLESWIFCSKLHYLSHSPKQNHLQRSKATKEGRRNIVAPPL